jgi:LmbE family N-acetylglucosaminyl deacetylase
MRALWLGTAERVETILAIGAHADDIEIGCGGTLLQLAELCPGATVHWVVLGADGPRAEEARMSAAEFTAGFASSQVVVEGFRDGYFPHGNGAVKDRFEQLKSEVAPALILTHQRNDLHQDHRHVSELTWNTFRDHLILEYEIPKYDGDLGAPNVFVPLSEGVATRKVELILNHFATQHDKQWFTADLFHSLMRLRGMEAHAPDGRAEAFYGRKVVLGGGDG